MPDNNGVQYTNPPQSRNEAILESMVTGEEYTDPPQSRIEDLLLQVKAVFEAGGGGGGTSVVANPQLVGGEANLNSIKIGNVKYRLVPENVIQAFYDIVKLATFSEEPSTEDFATIEDYLDEIVATLESISASKSVVSYVAGSQLDTSDISVIAHWSNGTESNITEDAVIDTSQVDMSTPGTYGIGIEYTSNEVTETTTITITIVAEEVTLSSISASKSVVSYVAGSQLDTSDISVTAHWSNGTESNVTQGAHIDTSQVDMSTPGTYDIGVEYTSNGVFKTTSITITVIAAPSRTVTPLGTFVSGTIPSAQGTPAASQNACHLQGISLQSGQKIGFKDSADYSSYRFAFGYNSSVHDSWIKNPNDSTYWTSDANVPTTAGTYGFMILHLKVNDQSIPITAEDIAYINQNFGVITEV